MKKGKETAVEKAPPIEESPRQEVIERPLVPVETPRPYNGVAIREFTPDTPLLSCPTSLNPDDPVQRAMLFNVGNPGDIDFDRQTRALRVTAVHWAIIPDEREDPDSGEISRFGRLVLIQADGTFYRTSSAFAPRRLKSALELYTRSEWDRGIVFEIRERRSKLDRTYHDIRVVTPHCA